MAITYEVREGFRNLLDKLHSERALLTVVNGNSEHDNMINVENIYRLASNSVLEDFPRLYGINDVQRKLIVEYFGERISKGDDFILELHDEFSRFLEPERGEYISKFNKLNSIPRREIYNGI
jgi:hypothetical protein